MFAQVGTTFHQLPNMQSDMGCFRCINILLPADLFSQRRISACIISEEYACLEALVGQESLRRTVLNEGPDSILIKLRIPLSKGTDPDDTYCDTPYEKGYAFLKYLQSHVGVKHFDSFLKVWTLPCAVFQLFVLCFLSLLLVCILLCFPSNPIFFFAIISLPRTMPIVTRNRRT